MKMRSGDAAGLVAGYLLDVALGDPRRFHPVAGFGSAAGALERASTRRTARPARRTPRSRSGCPCLPAWLGAAVTRRQPVARAVLVAAATWAVLGGRTLRREARRHGRAPGARRPAGRPATGSATCAAATRRALDEPELARATVESVAENTSDAVVAPLFWGARRRPAGAARLPGGQHARRDGRAPVGAVRPVRHAVRPARRPAQPGAVPADRRCSPSPSRRSAAAAAREALRVWRRDRNDHPSPNAGQCESAMAGALGVRLGGRNVYFGRTETRPFLGDGPRPTAGASRRAARLSGAVGVAALALAAGLAAARTSRRWTERKWPMSGGLLVAGTTSDAGKSVLTAGICRWLHRRGVKVAPFKAQNMSNNSAVVVGAGRPRRRDRPGPGDAGRRLRARARRALQPGAAQAGQRPLQPGRRCSARRSTRSTAGNYRDAAAAARRDRATRRSPSCAREYDVVICEGAGSPAEINLRDGDFVNMGLARHAGLPDDRGRRHRPRRRVRRAVRHASPCSTPRTRRWSAASSSTSSAATSGCSQPGLDMLTAADRAADVRRAAVRTSTSGSTPRTRSRTAGCSAGPAPPRGTRVAARRGGPAAARSPTPPTPRRWPPSRACGCGSPSSPPRSPTPTWSSCPAASRPWTTSPGCARPAWPTRSHAHARGRQAAARHLRRLPDAGPRDPRRGGEPPGHGAGPGPAAGRGHVRRAQDPGRSSRARR